MEFVRFTVLLVEGDAEIVDLALRGLNASGLHLTVRCAKDGEEALELLGLSDNMPDFKMPAPDLIICDLNLSESTGWQVLARMQRAASLSNTPIICFSSDERPSLAQQCLSHGATAFVRKPVLASEFIERVGAIARRWLGKTSR